MTIVYVLRGGAVKALIGMLAVIALVCTMCVYFTSGYTKSNAGLTQHEDSFMSQNTPGHYASRS